MQTLPYNSNRSIEKSFIFFDRSGQLHIDKSGTSLAARIMRCLMSWIEGRSYDIERVIPMLKGRGSPHHINELKERLIRRQMRIRELDPVAQSERHIRITKELPAYHLIFRRVVAQHLKTTDFAIRRVALAERRVVIHDTDDVSHTPYYLVTIVRADKEHTLKCNAADMYAARQQAPYEYRDEGGFTDPFTQLATKRKKGYIVPDGQGGDRVAKKPLDGNNAIRAFRHELIREHGRAKVAQVEGDFGLLAGAPLTCDAVHKYNIGVSSIEYADIGHLKEALAGDKPLPGVWVRNLQHLELSREEASDRVSEGGQEAFDLAMAILTIPTGDLERAYTGRKVTSNVINGKYGCLDANKSKTMVPWQDQQEVLQLHEELERGLLGCDREERRVRHYTELLSKVAIKKNLFRVDRKGAFRAGALLPSPWRDKYGRTVWMSVDATLSPFGKIAYTISPACGDASIDVPTFRLYRDTSRHPYCYAGPPTAVRDTAQNRGYLFADALEEEDRAFYWDHTVERGSNVDARTRRPLVIGGCSLGGFDAQYGMAHSLATMRGRVLAQPTRLYTNNALRLTTGDNERFLHYYGGSIGEMQRIGASLTFDHVVGRHDPIPRLCRDRTFLGTGTDEALRMRIISRRGRSYVAPELYVRAHPVSAIKDYHTHRYEAATEGLDIETKEMRPEEYDQISEDYLPYSRHGLRQRLHLRIFRSWLALHGGTIHTTSTRHLQCGQQERQVDANEKTLQEFGGLTDAAREDKSRSIVAIARGDDDFDEIAERVLPEEA